MRRALLVLVACNKPAAAPVPAVHVDERVETIAILERLAGSREDNQAQPNPYVRDVDAHFAAFAQDPAVAMTKQLHDLGLAFEQPMELAIRLDSGERPNDRWAQVDLAKYTAAIRAFAAASGVHAFLAEHAAYVHRVEGAFATKLAATNPLPFFANLLGPTNVAFTIVPALLQGPHSYGVHTATAFYQLIGLDPVDADGLPTTIDDALIVHEMAHSFVNPAVDAAAAELEPLAQAVFERVRAQMDAQHYGTVRIFLDESIVRAIAAHYVRVARGDAGAEKAIADEEAHGFVMTRMLEQALAPGTHSIADRISAVKLVLSTFR